MNYDFGHSYFKYDLEPQSRVKGQNKSKQHKKTRKKKQKKIVSPLLSAPDF